MHPYVIDRMVQERREELFRIARAERHVRAARWTGAQRRHSSDHGLVAFTLAMLAGLARRWAMRPSGLRSSSPTATRIPVEPCAQPAGRPC